MKKLLFLLVPFMVLLLSIKSFAYTGPTGATYQYEYVFTESGSTLKFYSNYLFFGCSQNNTSRPELCAYIPASASVADDIDKYYVTSVVTGRNTYYMYTPDKKYPSVVLNQDTQWITWAELKYNNGQSTSNWPVTWTPQIYQAAGVPVFTTYAAGAEWAYSEMQPDIDWNNPLYSIAIETPSFEVTYRNILYDQVDVPLNVNMTIDQQSELYCEVMAEYTLPNNLQYRYSSNSFEASQYTRISKTIVSAEQLVKARTLSASGLYAVLKNKYAECLQELPLSSVSIRFPSDFGAQEILDARQTYDELRQVCTVGGTAIKIYIRYFSIENDTQFVVGAWRIWNSTNPKSFGVELPSWYKPYIPASGDLGTNTTTDSDPDVVVIPAGGQIPTGQYYDPSINITVGSNVPNYPDYPTIATYNLDNMLVDTMNNARSLSGFFGEFGGFIQSVFVFLPSWIWAIIGVGFSLSIVVMFLKIL